VNLHPISVNSRFVEYFMYRNIPLCSFKFTALLVYRAVKRSWGGGGQCGKKNLLHWAREAHVHKTTFEPLIGTALYVIPLMRTNPLLWQMGGGWAVEIATFLARHSPNGSMPFHRARKSLYFQGSTSSHLSS
jgi:hypothetical protein